MQPSMQDQPCQIRLSHVQTKVLIVNTSRRIVIKTKAAAGNAMLPVATVPSQSNGEVSAEQAPSAPTGWRKTSERVSLAARVTCVRQADLRLTSAYWIDEAILCLSARATVAFQKYRFNNGLVLGTTLAAVSCYNDKARRMGLRPSQMQLTLIATTVAALSMIVQQQVLRAFVHL